jgi:hypothetical protein
MPVVLKSSKQDLVFARTDSLIFIVYTILFTICTLLKLYTIGYIAGSGGKNKGYWFKMSQLSSITRMEDDQ